jgi:hypothetical protein
VQPAGHSQNLIAIHKLPSLPPRCLPCPASSFGLPTLKVTTTEAKYETNHTLTERRHHISTSGAMKHVSALTPEEHLAVAPPLAGS